MNSSSANPPIILSFSSHDPSGCGGIQADIETAASLGCHCTAITSAMCGGGPQPGSDIYTVDSVILIEQARSILDTMDVKAVKIGFLGSAANAEAVHSILQDYKQLPVVSHPTMCLWNEENEEHSDLIEAYSALILPMSTVSIFSLHEARQIARETDTVDTTANALVSSGSEHVLITGTGKQTQAFQNSFYGDKGLIKNYPWEQEAPVDHGSNSTLTMSTATYMAHGFDSQQAVEQALNFTWQTMRASRDLGFDQRTPHRFFWADKNIDSPNQLPVEKSSH